MNDYYVYVYLREDRYSPYYVGKGRGRRCYSVARTSKKPDDKSRIVKIKEGLSEEESYELEKVLIKLWGRKDQGGILHNYSDGGSGPSGCRVPRTKEWKERISKSMTGRKLSEETKEKIRQSRKGIKPCHTTPHSQETKDLISKKLKGKKYAKK
jgi:hypothetical protein